MTHDTRFHKRPGTDLTRLDIVHTSARMQIVSLLQSHTVLWGIESANFINGNAIASDMQLQIYCESAV